MSWEDGYDAWKLASPPEPDPSGDDGFEAHIEECSKHCRCCPCCCDHPCAGTQAGGMCDEMRCRCDDEPEDYSEDWEYEP